MGTSAVKLAFSLLATLFFVASPSWAQKQPLIVVDDRGGDSAFPYYKPFQDAGMMQGGASRQAAPHAPLIHRSATGQMHQRMPQVGVEMPQAGSQAATHRHGP